MSSTTGLLSGIKSFVKKLIGIGSFKIVNPGETYNGRFYAIQSEGGDLIYSATTAKGDNLPSGSVLRESASIVGEFESIIVDGASSGSAIIYLL